MMIETTRKFYQGSVWYWANYNDAKSGLQSGKRPVLIVSNNLFNKHSPVVNCVTITSILKESPVHVPLHIHKASHIQCEQIHTITKNELTKQIGSVSSEILSAVKEKLCIQLNIGA